MDQQFFKFSDYRDFLRARFDALKAMSPSFSVRAFSKRAGIKSPSYFQMVVTGKRQLSVGYAEKFAHGLKLSPWESACLVTCVALESCEQPRHRDALGAKLEALKKQGAAETQMSPNHVAILADPVNLKLYLLAQAKSFSLKTPWLSRQFGRRLTNEDLEQRVAQLFDSGLWQMIAEKVTTVAPAIKTGHQHGEGDLHRTHENLLEAAKAAVMSQAHTSRVMGGRTFLFSKNNIAAVQERIDEFKRSLEAEFEDLDATDVYQLQVSFFELEPKEFDR